MSCWGVSPSAEEPDGSSSFLRSKSANNKDFHVICDIQFEETNSFRFRRYLEPPLPASRDFAQLSWYFWAALTAIDRWPFGDDMLNIGL